MLLLTYYLIVFPWCVGSEGQQAIYSFSHAIDSQSAWLRPSLQAGQSTLCDGSHCNRIKDIVTIIELSFVTFLNTGVGWPYLPISSSEKKSIFSSTTIINQWQWADPFFIWCIPSSSGGSYATNWFATPPQMHCVCFVEVTHVSLSQLCIAQWSNIYRQMMMMMIWI